MRNPLGFNFRTKNLYWKMKSSIKPSIWQQFEEHVYRGIDIADSIKFSYLISTLTGADWDYLSLQEQFGSDELIIQHHVKSLINGYGVCLDSPYGPITARNDMREYLMQMAERLKSKNLFTDVREMNEDYNKER
ncbi:hypothetical protein T12_5341, partial [Trichinella patagoniensis]